LWADVLINVEVRRERSWYEGWNESAFP
jgi:hypothetical protein